MEFYEYHYLLRDLTDHLKKEQEANKGQQDSTSEMMSGMKMPNMKVPTMKMPKL
jgi:hypothetical protein